MSGASKLWSNWCGVAALSVCLMGKGDMSELVGRNSEIEILRNEQIHQAPFIFSIILCSWDVFWKCKITTYTYTHPTSHLLWYSPLTIFTFASPSRNLEEVIDSTRIVAVPVNSCDHVVNLSHNLNSQILTCTPARPARLVLCCNLCNHSWRETSQTEKLWRACVTRPKRAHIFTCSLYHSRCSGWDVLGDALIIIFWTCALGCLSWSSYVRHIVIIN